MQFHITEVSDCIITQHICTKVQAATSQFSFLTCYVTFPHITEICIVFMYISLLILVLDSFVQYISATRLQLFITIGNYITMQHF